MADITNAASSVRPLPVYISRRFDAGGSIYAGQPVYIAADGDVEMADAGGTLTGQAIGMMIADNDGGTLAVSGDRVDVILFGPVTGFSSLTPGLKLFVSATAGGLTQDVPAVGSLVCDFGIALDASTILVNPIRTANEDPYTVKAS
jgi:hypothetical protein